jgi:isomerase DpgB
MISNTEFRTTGKTVHLRLSRTGPTLADTVGDILRTCQLAEETAQCSALVIHVQDSAQDLAGCPMTTQLLSQWERALKRLETVRVPTVCVIEGSCHGLMLELMLCTDHRIAGPDLEISLARAGDTLWPSMALYRLSAQLGSAQSRRLVLFGTPLTAEQALRLGLINSIENDPEAACAGFVAGLADARIQDLSVRRHLLLDSASSTYEDMLGSNMAACDRALRRQPASATAAAAAISIAADAAASLPDAATALRTHA